MTAPDLDRLEELAKGATPGPWRWQVSADRKWSEVWATEADGRPLALCADDDDADYLAALDPSTVLELIRLARQAQQALALAWDEGHRTLQKREMDDCRCGAWYIGECGCGKYGTGRLITPNPYRDAS